MKVYEQLSTEQLEKHREVLLWMVQEIDIELAKRADMQVRVSGENLEDHQLDFLH